MSETPPPVDLDGVSSDGLTGPEVIELGPTMLGRWLVTGQGSRHIWHLDAMTFTRIPEPDSRVGAMVHDRVAHVITRVTWWPRVGAAFLVWFDDPDRPDSYEQRCKSSRIRTIDPILGPSESRRASPW